MHVCSPSSIFKPVELPKNWAVIPCPDEILEHAQGCAEQQINGRSNSLPLITEADLVLFAIDPACLADTMSQPAAHNKFAEASLFVDT